MRIVFLITIFISAVHVLVPAHALDDLKPWPPAEEGYERKVIRLEPLSNENEHRVQIIAGKEMLIDCNHYHFEGVIKERTDIGWGYPSYWLDKPFGPLHTMMGCIDYPKRKEFVTVKSMIGDSNDFLTYNSKQPIVIYIPEDFDLRYRIWSSTSQFEYAPSE